MFGRTDARFDQLGASKSNCGSDYVTIVIAVLEEGASVKIELLKYKHEKRASKLTTLHVYQRRQIGT